MFTPHFDEEHVDQNVTCCCECLQVLPKGNDRLRKHFLQVHHSASEKWVCPDCGQEYSSRDRLDVHKAVAHSEEKVAVCQHCGKGFGHVKKLKVHLRSNHNPRDLQCPHW